MPKRLLHGRSRAGMRELSPFRWCLTRSAVLNLPEAQRAMKHVARLAIPRNVDPDHVAHDFQAHGHYASCWYGKSTAVADTMRMHAVNMKLLQLCRVFGESLKAIRFHHIPLQGQQWGLLLQLPIASRPGYHVKQN